MDAPIDIAHPCLRDLPDPVPKRCLVAEAQRRAYRIADNKLAERGRWDEAALSAELNGLLAEDFGLSMTITDARFAKPIDEALIARLAREHEVVEAVLVRAVSDVAERAFWRGSAHEKQCKLHGRMSRT